MSQSEETEPQGILVNSEFKVVTALAERKAYDKKSAAQIQELNTLLDILERAGVIVKNTDGKYNITKKSRQKQLKGFKIGYK